MEVGYQNINYSVQYRTEPRLAGLKDLKVIIVSPGSIYVRGPFTLQEIGSSGVYETTFIPKVTGAFHLKFSSVEANIKDVKVLNVIDINRTRNLYTKLILLLIIIQFFFLVFSNFQTNQNIAVLKDKVIDHQSFVEEYIGIKDIPRKK